MNLEREQQHKGHHKTEETHGFGQSEAQNGVREELLLETWVASIADDQATEDCANTGSGTSHSDCGSAGTDVFRRRVDIAANGARVDRGDRELEKSRF